MGTKYLGNQFDIHGGGLDLQFPHHECEIAQSVAANDEMPVKYWMHNNLVTLNGQKMGKSLGNAVSLENFFTGNHKLLKQPYNPSTIRFFMLQAHYRSPLDFSNEALQAAEKGLNKLLAAVKTLDKLKPTDRSNSNIEDLRNNCFTSMNDDFNSPILISHLFEGVRIINSVKDQKESISTADLDLLKQTMYQFTFEVLGLKQEDSQNADKKINVLMNTILDIRQNARERKDWETSDLIRDRLAKVNIQVKDTKDGAEWSMED
jgi:cysteinyl-tRNA synthetase